MKNLNGFLKYTNRPLSVLSACLIAGLLVLVGCDNLTDFESINEDPNNPTEVESSLQLPALLTEFSYEVIGNEPARTTSLWVQQTTQNSEPPNIDTYQLDESDVNNMWESFVYTGTLKDARNIQETAREEENLATVGIAQIVEAWSWAITTDLFGDIPYEEAFMPNENTNPSYSEQEVVYEGIFDLLENARQNLNEGNVQPVGSADLLYGGNLDKWRSLAWALEAKFHMKLTESGFDAGLDGGTHAQAALEAVQNAFPNGNADNAAFEFPGGEDAENPWYQFTIQGVWTTQHQVSDHYIGLLKDRDDPRLAVQARQVGAVDANASPPNSGTEDFSAEDFDPSQHLDPADDTYQGHENGAENAEAVSSVSSIGEYYSAEDAPLIWMNYAEVKLIEAEARHRTNSGDAEGAFEEGVRASLDQLGVLGLSNVDQTFVDNFVDDRVASYNSGDPLEQIITEKYIANFIRVGPYNDWRRTGYPNLSPVPNAETDDGEIPRRYPYPNSEYTDNSENVPTEIGRGVDALDVPVDWDPNS